MKILVSNFRNTYKEPNYDNILFTEYDEYYFVREQEPPIENDLNIQFAEQEEEYMKELIDNYKD